MDFFKSCGGPVQSRTAWLFLLEQAMNALFNALFGAPDQSHIPTPSAEDDRRFDRAMACVGIAAGIAAAVLSFVL